MNQPIRMTPSETERKGVTIFRLIFHNGLTIGPSSLKGLWSRALGSEDVSVSRDSAHRGSSSHETYLVRATVRPTNLESVESNLRRLLHDRFGTAHIELRRLV
jgi:hypothetical protein